MQRSKRDSLHKTLGFPTFLSFSSKLNALFAQIYSSSQSHRLKYFQIQSKWLIYQNRNINLALSLSLVIFWLFLSLSLVFSSILSTNSISLNGIWRNGMMLKLILCYYLKRLKILPWGLMAYEWVKFHVLINVKLEEELSINSWNN